MDRIHCCRECKSRTYNCHVICELYIKEKEELQKNKDKKYILNDIDRYRDDQIWGNRAKRLRKYGKYY